MKILINAATVAFIVLLMFSSAAVGQFSQSLYSLHDVRSEKMASWANGDQGKTVIVEQFTKKCLIGKPVKNNDIKIPIKKPISVYDCAKKHNFQELGSVIKDADSVLKSFAWPVSLLAKQS